MTAVLIIPALNEEQALRRVLSEVPRNLFEQVIVVDNGSDDATALVAEAAGAVVVAEPRRGYGSACLAGIAALRPEAEIVVFMDADGSDDPADVRQLIDPILHGKADLVLGSRELGFAEPGALSPHQRLGNRFALFLIALVYGRAFTDLGPFRAIRRSSLDRLGMSDPNFGWTVEMQVKALRDGLRISEVPVPYRKRSAGRSKVSGTVWGSLAAGVKILWTVGKYASARS